MTYAEHKANAATLTPGELDHLLRTLGNDDRFCAVVAWLERNKESHVSGGSRQELAGDYGKLAHGQGSVHAINVLIAQLANLLTPPAPTPGMEPPRE